MKPARWKTENRGKLTRRGAFRRGINLWAALLVIAGITLIYVSKANPIGIDSTWLHFCESLGHAIFIFGLISVFMEFRDFTEYVSCILQEQLLDRQYIRKLGATDLQGLKRDVDEVLVGATGLMSPGSFYEFVDQHFDALIRAPYRTRMIELNDFVYDTADKSRFWKTTTTTYNFVKGFSGNTPMTIKWSWTSLPLQSLTSRDQIREVIMSYSTGREKQLFRLAKPIDAAAPMTLKSAAGVQITVLESTTVLPMKVPAIQFQFEYEIPQSKDFRPTDGVTVEIREEVLIDAMNDNYTSLRVGYPTHGLIVEANFPQDVHAHQCAHGFSAQKVEPMVERDGKCFMNIDRWCLPGHGIVTIWHLPNSGDNIGNASLKANVSNPIALTSNKDMVTLKQGEVGVKSHSSEKGESDMITKGVSDK